MLSVSESARQLNISDARVRALIKSGQLPATKCGRGWVLREEDVLQRLMEKPKAGRPKNQVENLQDEELPPIKIDNTLHELYDRCHALFQHIPTEEMMSQAKSSEEASFYMAVSDFFLQQKQAQLVKSGVY